MDITKLTSKWQNIPGIIRMSPALFFMRLAVYQVMIASSQKKATLNILVLIVMELVLITFYLQIFIKHSQLCNKVTIISKISQSVTLCLFMVMCYKLSLRNDREIQPVGESIQTVGIYFLLINIASEYFYVAVSTFNMVYRMIWQKVNKVRVDIQLKK